MTGTARHSPVHSHFSHNTRHLANSHRSGWHVRSFTSVRASSDRSGNDSAIEPRDRDACVGVPRQPADAHSRYSDRHRFHRNGHRHCNTHHSSRDRSTEAGRLSTTTTAD